MSAGSANSLRLLVAEPERFHDAALATLQQHVSVDLRAVSRAELREAFNTYDAVWVRLGFRLESDMFGLAPRCRVLACPATGLDHIDRQAAEARGIRVVSLKGETAFLRDVRATGELTLALILSLLRRLPAATRSVASGTWNRDLFRGREIHEKTVGLVGLGRLGSMVARMLSGFDAKLIAYDPRHDAVAAGVERMSSLEELLERADIVSVHVTYDESTHHLIGATELGRMQADAYLINTSRGGVLDEDALLTALEAKRIAGAALDVLQGEPHPELQSNRLVRYASQHDNLIIVPHIGGNTFESARKTELFIANKVLEALGIGGGAT